MRRAKIVATIGPACSDGGTLEKFISAGMDVARLNFSHGKHSDHAEVIARIRTASRDLRRAVALLQDLQGPKIRTGKLKAGRAGVELVRGRTLTITVEEDVVGDADLVSTTYEHLAEDVKPGDRILMDDGLLELRVVESDGTRVRTEVVEGGTLGESKGINLPGVKIRAEAMSEKDREDMAFGLANGVDYVALSFVRSPDDVRSCREEMRRCGRVVPIIAKIEKPEALVCLDEIVAAADGLMVARGDLGVEIQPERVPGIQKDMCRRASAAGKPVIIATQMLNSMIEHPRPTRAEASDVANGIWDGADAVMLSGETASGRFPIPAIQMMDRIIREAESTMGATRPPVVDRRLHDLPFPEVTADAACRAAAASGATLICCFTLSGSTARLVSRYRPGVPIVGFSPDQDIRRRLALYWGVLPRVMEPLQNTDMVTDMVSERLVEDGLAKPGDRIVLVYGSPVGIAGQTNSIRLHEIPHPADLSSKRYRVPI